MQKQNSKKHKDLEMMGRLNDLFKNLDPEFIDDYGEYAQKKKRRLL